jgi:hypothetical protein
MSHVSSATMLLTHLLSKEIFLEQDIFRYSWSRHPMVGL